MWESLWTILSQPVLSFTEPENRVFLPALGTSLLMALWALRSYQSNWRDRLRTILDRRVWSHPSARIDLSLWILGRILRIGGFIAVLIPATSLAVLVAAGLEYSFGQIQLDWHPQLIGALLTFCMFVADDVSRFWLHRSMHKTPWLWAFHRVHHSAEVLTPFSLFRVHPVESVLFGLRGALVMGLLSGIFLFLFRDRFHGWDILGVNSFGLLFNHLGANLRHSHIPLSFGRLERWLLSPAQHQIHHSADPRHHDKNFGTFLAFWDHWAGSHHPGDEAASGLTFGLTGSGSEVYQPHATIGQVLMEPFRSQRHLKSQS